MPIDTRKTSYTAVVEIIEAKSEGLVSKTDYAADGKLLPRSTDQVSHLVIRADNLGDLQTRIADIVKAGAIF